MAKKTELSTQYFFKNYGAKYHNFHEVLSEDKVKFPLLNEIVARERQLTDPVKSGNKVLYFSLGNNSHLVNLAKKGANVVVLNSIDEDIQLTMDRLRQEGIPFRRIISDTLTKDWEKKYGPYQGPGKVLIFRNSVRNISLYTSQDIFDYCFCFNTLPILSLNECKDAISKFPYSSTNGAFSVYDQDKFTSLMEYYKQAGFDSSFDSEDRLDITRGFHYNPIKLESKKSEISMKRFREIETIGLGSILSWKTN